MNDKAESRFTPAQEKALKDAWDIITEHFDRAVLLVNTDMIADDQETATSYYWRGGSLSAIGLMEVAKRRLTESAFIDEESHE